MTQKSEKDNHVRVVSLGVFRKDSKILATECYDNTKKQTFYRALGGGIEFGEPSSDALKREIKEEIGEDIEIIKNLGVLEAFFTFEGNNGHEIVFVYEAAFKNKDAYNKPYFLRIDSEKPFKSYWKEIEDFISGKLILVPEGLSDILKKLQED